MAEHLSKHNCRDCDWCKPKMRYDKDNGKWVSCYMCTYTEPPTEVNRDKLHFCEFRKAEID